MGLKFLWVRDIHAVILMAIIALSVSGCSHFDGDEKKVESEFEQQIENFMKEARAISEGEASVIMDRPTAWEEKKNEKEQKEEKYAIPSDYVPWWHELVNQPLFENSQVQSDSISCMYGKTLAHSSQIRVFSAIPLIRETGIQEAQGRFDISAFIDTKYEDAELPVGSTLTSRVTDTIDSEEKAFEAGLRRKFTSGADVSISQRLNNIKNNAEYLSPNPQMEGALTFSVVQPLLNGAGVEYNKSSINIAKLDSEIAMEEFLRQVQLHLMEVTKAYWGLYLARASFLQKRKLFEDTAKISEQIESRKSIDTVKNQSVRVKAALAERRADMVRSEMAVRNAEDRIKALVNDPGFIGMNTELIPATLPIFSKVGFEVKDSAVIALDNRHEIKQGFRQLKALEVRRNMAKNELLPQLNLIFEYAFKDIEEDMEVGKTLENEFDRDSFMVGLSLEYPLCNNIARARLQRRKLELRQQLSQIKTSIETIMLEVKIAVREVYVAFRDIEAKYHSMIAARENLDVLIARQGIETRKSDRGSVYLEFLLDGQDRLAEAEEEMLKSLAAYNVAVTNLERSKGTLLQYESISIERKGKDNAACPTCFKSPMEHDKVKRIEEDTEDGLPVFEIKKDEL